MQAIIETLHKQLTDALIDVEHIKIEHDPYGYLSIWINYEISYKLSDLEQTNIELEIMSFTIPYFSNSVDLERLILQAVIIDDKVASEPLGFNKVDLLAWHSGQLNSDELYRRRLPYWYSGDREFLPQRFGTIRAYIVCFFQKALVGLHRNDQWYLPGGVVKGQTTPSQIITNGDNFYRSLEWYLKEQTGLTIFGWSQGAPIILYNKHQQPELTLLYGCIVKGDLNKGSLLPVDNLPNFAPECGNVKAYTLWYINRMKRFNINLL